MMVNNILNATWCFSPAVSVFVSDRTLVVPQPEPQAPPPPSSTPSSAPPTPPPAVHPAADTLFPVTDMPVVESPGLHPQCSPSAAPPAESTALGQPPQLRQRLGDDLIRLVQVAIRHAKWFLLFKPFFFFFKLRSLSTEHQLR